MPQESVTDFIPPKYRTYEILGEGGADELIRTMMLAMKLIAQDPRLDSIAKRQQIQDEVLKMGYRLVAIAELDEAM